MQEGIYHGRIILPAEYPFKPPSFTLLTPNGRFELNTKICLSISSHHPEHWQPSWSIRTALTALIAFMPSPGQGAIGSLVSLLPFLTALHPRQRVLYHTQLFVVLITLPSHCLASVWKMLYSAQRFGQESKRCCHCLMGSKLHEL